ncbi:hypothetical protein GCM10008904_28870 [Paraclostridium ghonii]|uniref:Uncharacterized protein n=1 Tax=Paraclostridium ghonii TaxID=29358 RepID=A0ABU0N3C2_9FIRM|nr:hypothetical protein [Paeniclostridium ghonii]MDQ0557625.1 hypothetical protein [Paeniclostridium ghonii]
MFIDNIKDTQELINNVVDKTKEPSVWDSAKTACDGINTIISGVFNLFGFIKNCITDPDFLINFLKDIAPDTVLIILSILIIMRFLGFESTGKWIAIILVIAFVIGIL